MAALADDAKDTLKMSPTVSGGAIDPWNPDPLQIDIRDIAHGLSVTFRYAGQTDPPYTVAQHSVYVAKIVSPDRQLAALLHDGPEYLTGDLPHHIKYGDPLLTKAWKTLDGRIARAIESRFGLEPGELDDPVIKDADYQIFNYEWESLITKDGHVFPDGRFMIVPWSVERSKREFMDAFNCYTGR